MANATKLFKERPMVGSEQEKIIGKPLSWAGNWRTSYPKDCVFMVGVESKLVRGFVSDRMRLVKKGMYVAPHIPGLTTAEEEVVPVRFKTVCSIFRGMALARSRTVRMAD